ncbi:hypothetical protein Btru_045772 [Bulinus truncatus]|nr:hypothetical protein Btru_045772 [Bulinus truncatus]
MDLDICCGATFYLLLIVFGLVTYLIYKHVMSTETWEKYGVKHINVTRIMSQDLKQTVRKVIQEEGDTMGFKLIDLTLITRDLNILKHVLVKDFNNYVDRAAVICSNSPVEKGVFFLSGQDWKRVRHVITPSFSTGKLKLFTNFINESGTKLATLFDTYFRNDDLVDIKHLMGQFTGEIIARTAFSLKTDCLGKAADDEFTRYSKEIFQTPNKIVNFFLIFLFQWKWLHVLLVKTFKMNAVDSVSRAADQYFQTILQTTMSERQKLSRDGHRPYTDLFQNMMSAKEAGDKELKDVTGKTDPESWDSLPKTMSEEELLGQSMFIIFAGFDTTATTLQMCFYHLAKHHDVDAKVYEEIQKVVTSDSPTYEEISQLKYMEQVLNETLRLYPPAPIISRRAAETRTYGDVTIPKGAGLIIPLDMIMKDPKHFPDPEIFDPDRFSEENVAKRDPMSFVPFGYGPRQCIGLRLAYMELKYCLVHVLRKIKFELNQRTEPKPDGDIEISYSGVISVKKPIMLAVKPRNN